MQRAVLGLNKGQKERLSTYLDILEQSVPKPPDLLSISKRTKDRVAQKHRNYKHAIEIIRHLMKPMASDIDFKSNKKHQYSGEILHLHLKGRKRKVREIPQCKQSTQTQSFLTNNFSKLQIL